MGICGGQWQFMHCLVAVLGEGKEAAASISALADAGVGEIAVVPGAMLEDG